MAQRRTGSRLRDGAAATGGLAGTGALIKVGYRCDQRCVFCHASADRDIEAPADRIHALIERAASLGHRRVVLSGGEPTLRPELLDWAARAARRGMGFGLVSNGQRLADRALVAALCANGLEYVHLSLHGPREAHREATGTDSHGAVRRALAELAGRVPRLVVNCVVTRLNLAHLDALARELAHHAGVVLKFSMVEPKGEALARFGELVPAVEDGAYAVADAIRGQRAHGSTLLGLAHDGVPLCLLPDLADLRSDLRAEGLTMMAEAHEHDLYPIDDRNRVHPPRCRLCSLRGRCPGLFRATSEAYGDGALGPAVQGPQGNSFHYVLQRWMVAPEESCPVAAIGIAPWDRGRDLWVRHGARVAHYRSETRDFTDRELEEVKLEHEQLYFDAASRAAPTDFRRELLPLRRAARCAQCADESRCTRLYEPCWNDLFAANESRLREILATLTGDLLDIGCGEGLCCDALEPAVRAGRTRYLGIDPAAEPIRRLRARHPWADARVGTEEELEPCAEFDHVLLLGSWNHLPDPAAAAVRIVRRLRPGGTLLVSDDVPFALARSPGRASLAERADTPREHRRLDALADALRELEPLGLAPLERLDVGPATGTRWLVHLRRPSRT